MARKQGSNGARLDRHDKEIEDLKRKSEEAKKEYENHIQYHVIEDLNTERFTNSGKYMYTYADIANRHNIPISKVQKIAEENNLTRRNRNNKIS